MLFFLYALFPSLALTSDLEVMQAKKLTRPPPPKVSVAQFESFHMVSKEVKKAS
jgi:hypothetical protein